MHGKEKILQPLFNRYFFATLITPESLDTDKFGTFTGEIKRDQDLKDVLRKKAFEGIKLTGLNYALASEGTFRPHPQIPFIECNQESLIFLDTKNKVEIFSHTLSTESKNMYIEAKNINQIRSFLIDINLGKQGVIVKPSFDYKDSKKFIYKGLTSSKEVYFAYLQIKKKFKSQSVWIETDNRAFMSPKRQQVIYDCGLKLINKLKSLCPKCSFPGFEVKDYEPGLRCSNCNIPSNKPLKEIWHCINPKCSYKESKNRSDGRVSLDPTFCDWCNP